MLKIDIDEVSQELHYDPTERIFHVEVQIVHSKPLVFRANDPVQLNIPLSARSVDKIQQVLRELGDSDSQLLN